MTEPGRDDVEDVLFEFAAEPVHDRATLEKYLREFPGLAEELVDLSLELRLQRLSAGVSVPADEQWVEASWQAFQAVVAAPATTTTATGADPFAVLSSAQLVALRRDLGVPSGVVQGFRTRIVDLATVPEHFLASLGNGLRTTLADLRAFLAGPPRLAAALSYKANKPPAAAAAKISFEQLLADAKVPEEQRRRLLSGGD